MTNRERARKFFEQFTSNSKVLVIINADPDAIASAMTIKRLLWRKVSEVTIAHFNRITRPDNLTMIELVEAGLVSLSAIDPEEFTTFVVVDSQPDHNEAFSPFTYDVIIDHHPLSCPEANFVDIRPDYGACSSMMTEYLKARNIKPSAKLAAALMLGIKTDTSNFTRQATIRDIRAFQYLYQFANNNIVVKVERAQMTPGNLDFLARAIKQRHRVNNRIYFHAGRKCQPDELVMAADFFLSVSKVNWSVVSGVSEKKLIIIIRNDGLRKSAGITAKEAFASFGSAGGHKTMARAELDLKLIRREIGRIGAKVLSQWIIDSIEQVAGKKIE